jgi:hypothetical protein
MQLTPDEQRLWKIFHPKAAEEESKIINHNIRFVHYTSAATVLKILSTKRIWMRKTSCMNDYREVLHGLECLVKAYDRSHLGKTFKTTLDSMFEGFSARIQHLFNSWIQNIQNHTYISCFSEHRPEDDLFGRLSMWRAYGVNTGAAFVLNNSAFQLSPDLLKVYASPVAYLSEEAFQNEFGRIVDNINAEVDCLKNQGQDKVMGCVFRMFRFAIVSTKNPCFKEEMSGVLSTLRL